MKKKKSKEDGRSKNINYARSSFAPQFSAHYLGALNFAVVSLFIKSGI